MKISKKPILFLLVLLFVSCAEENTSGSYSDSRRKYEREERERLDREERERLEDIDRRVAEIYRLEDRLERDGYFKFGEEIDGYSEGIPTYIYSIRYIGRDNRGEVYAAIDQLKIYSNKIDSLLSNYPIGRIKPNVRRKLLYKLQVALELTEDMESY